MATEKQKAAARRNIKKAQAANRRKGRGGGGRSARRRKPIQRGLLGRLGAFMAGVTPPAIVTVGAAEDAYAHHKAAERMGGGNILSTIKIGLYDWVNGFTEGLFGKKVFEKATYALASGQKGERSMPSIVPPGSLWLPIGAGVSMMAVDRLASWLAGGRPVKIIGTNYNATGGS